MSTITKKELIDYIADATGEKRVVVKKVVQSFLDNIIIELGKGNRLEFRDFGVFEVRHRRRRMAQNPKTLEPVEVPPKRSVKFKVGRLMKNTLAELDAAEMSEAMTFEDYMEDGQATPTTNAAQPTPGTTPSSAPGAPSTPSAPSTPNE